MAILYLLSYPPAYDLVSTLSYLKNRELALNFAKVKNFYQIDDARLKYFSKRADIPESLVLETVNETITLARDNWPKLMESLPVTKELRESLQAHMKQLPTRWRISS